MESSLRMDAPAAARLDRERYLSLETFKRDGTGVRTPVWFAERDGRLYVFTEAASWKVKRLRNDPRIRVAACGARGALRGGWHPGRARRVDDPEEESRGYEALRRKYGWQMRLTDLLSRLAGRIEGRVVLALELDA